MFFKTLKIHDYLIIDNYSIVGEHSLHRTELIDWYLGEVEEDMQSEQDLIDTKLLVEMVIDRLVKHVSDTIYGNYLLSLFSGILINTMIISRNCLSHVY